MTEEEALARLRADAKARGLDDLVLAYGWSLIRLGMEQLLAMIEAEEKQ